jgi:hypothetical protein
MQALATNHAGISQSIGLTVLSLAHNHVEHFSRTGTDQRNPSPGGLVR